MPKFYESREDEVSAANTDTPLARLGSDGALGNVRVPAGVSRISEVWISAAPDTTFTVAIAAIIFIRLSGNGMPDGPETLIGMGIGQGGITAVANTNRTFLPTIRKVDFKVTPTNQIRVAAEMTGDLGVVNVGVTVVFK